MFKNDFERRHPKKTRVSIPWKNALMMHSANMGCTQPTWDAFSQHGISRPHKTSSEIAINKDTYTDLHIRIQSQLGQMAS